MRDIKFRAWDKRHYKFLYKFFYDRNWYNKDDKCVRGLMPECQHHQILEQYTGLKDKNGKEIYEGDVIKIDGVLSGGFHGGELKTFICDVSFGGGAFIVRDLKRHGYCEYLGNKPMSYTIIGNIHKNPELLKG